MSSAQILGAFLVALPFLALAIVTVREMGWRGFVAVFGGTALIVAVLAAGVYLMVGDLW